MNLVRVAGFFQPGSLGSKRRSKLQTRFRHPRLDVEVICSGGSVVFLSVRWEAKHQAQSPSSCRTPCRAEYSIDEKSIVMGRGPDGKKTGEATGDHGHYT